MIMRKLILFIVLSILCSCVVTKSSYNIYFQKENYQLTESELKMENSVPSQKNNATFFYNANDSDVIKLYSDGVEVPHETETWVQNGHKLYYFSIPKPKEEMLIKVNDKEFKILTKYLERHRHISLVKNNIYLSKSPLFSGEENFDFGKKINIK